METLTHVQDAGAAPVGFLLARTRKARRISQMDLAGDAGVSARHLSFVETGRARPSRELVLRLCDTLGVGPREADAFLLAAGFAPAHRETPLEAPAMSEILAALRLLLSRHDPLPAAAFDQRYDYVMINASYADYVNACLGAGADAVVGSGPVAPLTLLPAPRPNMLRLLCHPLGARRVLGNWAGVTREVLGRAAREVRALPADPARQPPLDEVRRHPGVASVLRTAPGSGLLVPVEIRQPDGGIARFMTTLSTVGTAQDLTLRELRIETFHPIAGSTEGVSTAERESR
ncbi:MAG: helix-turn-helix domain-containing protein [Acetobacteraceae bacterium]